MESKEVWQRTDQAPVDTYVVGYFESDDFAIVKYTHDRGWIDRDGESTAVPACWVYLPGTLVT